MNRLLDLVLIFSVVAISFLACQKKESSEVPEPAQYEFVRFEKLLKEAYEEGKDYSSLKEEYPIFSEIYVSRVIGSPEYVEHKSDSVVLTEFMERRSVQLLYDTAAIILGDLSGVERDFGVAFAIWQRWYPGREVPSVYTCISEFGVGAFSIEENRIGLGLDFYLGEDFPYPDLSSFPYYHRRAMTKEHMVMRGLQAWLEALIPQPEGSRMIDLMCRQGKILYLLERMLPEHKESTIHAYTEEELEWCYDNEQQIWTFFIEEDLLYETERRRIRRYLDPAPHSAGMPDGAPGRTARWIGHRIIRRLVDEGLSIQEVMLLEDGQEILEKARYKGR